MTLYTIDIFVDDWSGYGAVSGATVTMNGISKVTGSDGHVKFANVEEGYTLVTVTKTGYIDYIYQFYVEQNDSLGIPFKKETCTSNPSCELDENGNNTGYMLDGCGGKFWSPHCPITGCTPSTSSCEKDSNGNNTGYLIDNCGNRTLNESECPLPCIPNPQCEKDIDGNNTGYVIDGCGLRELNLTQCPLPCIPNPQCEKDANGNNTGYMLDGCGGKIQNELNCPIPIVCNPTQCNFIIEDQI